MAKEDKKKFQLNKGTNHNFDISKGGKRRFDLEKDPGDDTTGPQDPSPSKNSGKKWLWILLAIIVVAVLALWLWPTTPKETQHGHPESVEEASDPVTGVNDNESGETTSPDISEETSEDNSEPNTDVATSSTETTVPATPSVSTSPANVSDDVEAEALRVIRGDYGVGQVRKDNLGDKYQSIQSRVNQMKREGRF